MKKTHRKKKKTSKKSSFNLKYIIYFLILIIFSLSAFIVGIVYTQKNYEKELKKTQNSIKILQEKIKQLKSQTKIKKENASASVPSEIMDYNKAHNTTVILPPKETVQPVIPVSKKPKLVIIIDDVSFKGQVNKIKAIPFHVTPSFFPPTNRHPNTAIYAKEFSHYMIHLPLEAIHFNKPEPKTLNINDSYATILNRIKEVKKDFPKAKFINNHTGSTFTANKEAMLKLFRALKTEHLGFVDSKTTPYSKSQIADKTYRIPLYSRNIFLDNEENPEYIRNQLKKAIRIAKKRGYAIAIGHPHSVTLQTLKNSTDLLKNIDVVYIDELAKK
ncbi:hypothetical protein C3L23_05910 [Nautilia sp. PV-1]|jgi:polysaccharide deacetylase 2 family uncharacterized protein YibQ/uncharacterized protein YneF (UPF0154 family)|uniref:divergent polysaccharide deacetylase family protein n=1 Tax=Nautilia sp. PV-1 TaxID=2579250 RepID=UPI000FDB3FE8|nr:divergent polysaccharide deacetylase family protein [Nautilia sp. PV-1]AZV46823.1 hypothetical protein C3L23_05910 [Nautilia sp. PV-1]